MRVVARLYNGGLDAEHAEPGELRERRALAMASMLVAIVGVVLFGLNVGLGLWTDALLIAPTAVVGPTSLFLLVRLGHPRWVAQLLIAAVAVIPASVMANTGLSSVAWLWLCAVPLIATLLSGSLGGAVWTLVSLAIVWAAWAGHALGVPFEERVVTPSTGLAIDVSLFILATAALTQGFHRAQLRAEQGMRETVRRLQVEVDIRRQAELRARQAADTAREAEQAKDHFLATVSHEIRTPMNGVLGATQLLSDTRLDEDQRELLTTIGHSGELLLSLVNDVLDLSRLTSDKLVLETLATDIHATLEEVSRAVQWSAADKGIELEVEIASDLPRWLTLDPTRTRQVLLNLLSNAVKFTDEGHVRMHADRDEAHLRIRVEDTGIGIPEAMHTDIFAPFVQAEPSTTRRFGGTGLGLAIVQQTVRAMGGEVRVDSEEGLGSTFTVRLPLLPAEPPSALPDEVDAAPAQVLRVLVVDDNAVNRMIAERMIVRLGHGCSTAHDGEDALEQARDGACDVILMDVRMPGMDGLEATRRIRALDGAPSTVPIVGLSANAAEQDRTRATAAGMDDYLAKPVRLEALAAALERWTDRRHVDVDEEPAA